VELVPGKVSSGAVGDGTGDLAVPFDLIGRDVVALLQEPNETGEGVVLGRARPFLVEVANETDADGVFVPVVVVAASWSAVGTFALLLPAESDLDFSVGGAVVDNEVVADAVPAAFLVPAVDFRQVATFAGGVMDDDAAPVSHFPEAGGRYPGGGHVGRPIVRGREGAGRQRLMGVGDTADGGGRQGVSAVSSMTREGNIHLVLFWCG